MNVPPISLEQARSLNLRYYTDGPPCRKGHPNKRYVSSRGCAKCSSDRVRAEARRRHLHDPSWRLYTAAMERARKQNLPFTIVQADIKVSRNCPCCGVPFAFAAAKRQPASPSLDKITNMLGYMPGNIAVICVQCNFVKRDASPAELRRIADWIDESTRPLNVPVSSDLHPSGAGFQEGLCLTF